MVMRSPKTNCGQKEAQLTSACWLQPERQISIVMGSRPAKCSLDEVPPSPVR